VPASSSVSSPTAAPERAGDGARAPSTRRPGRPGGITGDLLLGLGLAAGLVSLAFVTTGGVDQIVTAPDTWAEIVVTLIGALGCGAAVLVGARGRAWGGVTIGLFAALTGLTALSITWSVEPDFSWFGANQMLSYLAVFAGGAAVARLAPERWRALLGGIAALMVALSAFSLLAKVFPATLNSGNTVGRLEQPFGYWNAIGVCAALGIPACLWSGARRDGGLVLRALSAPALSVLISVVVLSYSRSALLVAILGAAAWLAVVPLRLRAVTSLALGAAGAGAISGWALATPGLTSDGASPAAQTAAGHTFGVVLLVVLAIVAATALGVALAMARRTVAPAIRRRVGIALVVLAAMIPVAGVVALAASSRGLGGEISHAWNSLTQTKESVGDNASRILQFGNSRPLYWHEGLKVGAHALLKGVGALGYGTARLRYSSDRYKADHAHSYLIETFADLGLIGIALTLALLVAWCLAAARAVAWRARWASLTAAQALERQGLMTLAIIVAMFGVQSAIDWTWYFPGVVIPVLLCAGWLAGRGPLAGPVGRLRGRAPILQRPGAGLTITALVALALLGSWVIWQPLRSSQQTDAATTARSNPQAFADARSAASSDPLAYGPVFVLSALYERIHETAQARAELVDATALQPQNPVTWEQLGGFDLAAGKPRQAMAALGKAAVLDPTSEPLTAEIAQASAAAAPKPRPTSPTRPRARSRAPAG
jgi:hypothetical protein